MRTLKVSSYTLFLLGLLSVPLVSYSVFLQIASLNLLDGVALLGLIFLFVLASQKKSLPLPPVATTAGLILLLGAAVISTLSLDIQTENIRFIGSLILKFSFFYLAFLSINTLSRLKAMQNCFLLLTAITAIIGLSQWFFGLESSTYPAITGPFQNRNEMLLYLVPGAVLAFSAINRSGKKTNDALALIIFFLAALTIILSRGRAGLLLLIVGVVIVVILERRASPGVKVLSSAVLAALIPLVILGIMAFPSPELFDHLLKFNSTDGLYLGDQMRVALIKAAFEILSENWLLGIGPNGFSELSTDYVLRNIDTHKSIPEGLNAHNTYLEIFLAIGFVGLTGLGLLVSSGLSRIFEINVYGVPGRHLLVGLYSALCVNALAMLTISAIHQYVFWVLLGVILAVTDRRKVSV